MHSSTLWLPVPGDFTLYYVVVAKRELLFFLETFFERLYKVTVVKEMIETKGVGSNQIPSSKHCQTFEKSISECGGSIYP